MSASAPTSSKIKLFRAKKKMLKSFILRDPYLDSSLGNYKRGSLFRNDVVFVSVTDGSFSARVFCACGDGFASAFDTAMKKTESFVAENNFDPLWLKVDYINSSDIISRTEFTEKIRGAREFFFKKGVSFDVGFETALLEAQLNCCGLIDYKLGVLNDEKIKQYLAECGTVLTSIPDMLVEFTTVGYICDENKKMYKLYPDEENYGRRIIGELTKDDIKQVIETSSVYLANAVKDNGQFDYGVNPVNDFHFVTYNILRHSGTIWSLIMQYDITKDEKLISKIESTINFLMQSIEYSDDDHAYLVERKADEIKLGGNAIAIVTLSTYASVFGSNKYDKLITALANSILDMQEANGSYYHVLSFPGFERKERDRIVYYDGEATFALARAYSVTNDRRYLDAAEKALDYFIENDYTRFCDHWIAYAVNEVTIYDPKERYLNFGLKNANDNLGKIFNQDTTFHTFLELLMAAFSLYERIKEKKIYASYMQKFNFEAFIRTIYRRAHYMLGGYLYPETAMYMKVPLSVAYTFCVRHDSYRIRIDDVQHYIGGYYNFYNNFDKLDEYYKDIIDKPKTAQIDTNADSERASFVNWILSNI
ncbi:MAG TPA: glycosyl hydrolase family 88 [Ruminococcaceae bacterium]|nr:glycosyl hydrolase family 88 [Oscillospiraceae bacterium]HCE25898.1 glycosyl hydrolase family 88 [Oscillospiraceae bacterium]